MPNAQCPMPNYKCLLTLPNKSANISIRESGEVAEWSKAADC
ncbi:hypothetical protein [Nostoc sp.]